MGNLALRKKKFWKFCGQVGAKKFGTQKTFFVRNRLRIHKGGQSYPKITSKALSEHLDCQKVASWISTLFLGTSPQIAKMAFRGCWFSVVINLREEKSIGFLRARANLQNEGLLVLGGLVTAADGPGRKPVFGVFAKLDFWPNLYILAILTPKNF